MTDAIAMNDRGLLYGHGAFETLSVAEGVPLFLDYHLSRLQLSLQRLEIPLSIEQVQSDIQEKLQQLTESLSPSLNKACRHRSLNGILKLLVTAGRGERGYASPSILMPNTLIDWFPCEQLAIRAEKSPISVVICQTMLSINPLLAGLKHLNRLEQVLAANEVKKVAQENPSLNIGEGLLSAGVVNVGSPEVFIEATAANLFLVEISDQAELGVKWSLVTPPIDQCGVAGVARQIIIEEASRIGLEVKVEAIDRERLQGMSYCFLSSSGIGIVPVDRVFMNPLSSAGTKNNQSNSGAIDSVVEFWCASGGSSERMGYNEMDSGSASLEDAKHWVHQCWIALQDRINHEIHVAHDREDGL